MEDRTTIDLARNAFCQIKQIIAWVEPIEAVLFPRDNKKEQSVHRGTGGAGNVTTILECATQDLAELAARLLRIMQRLGCPNPPAPP